MRHLIPSLLVAFLLIGSAHAGLYRWVDENGDVHFTDKVPPKQYSTGRTTKLGKGGIGNEEIGRSKTKEELLREKELKQLRKEQLRLTEEQEQKDAVLLHTFRNEDEIILTRDGKLAAIDARIKLAKNNLKRLKSNLEDLQSHAAGQERAGKRVKKSVLRNIESTEDQIERNYGNILKSEEDKEVIREKYNEELVRFRQLKNLHTPKEEQEKEEVQRSVLVDTLVICNNQADCDIAWKKAWEYVKQHATTKIKTSGENILLTATPRSDQDISLTVSRLNNRKTGAARIFMDLQCKETVSGRKFCATKKVANVRQGFRAAVTP